MEPKIVTLDIETENTGYDILNHNKRIISVQIRDDSEKIFYDGSSEDDLLAAKESITAHIKRNNKFVGFNIRNFDVPLIRKFMGVEIQSDRIVEISEMDYVTKLKQKMGGKNPRLVQVCQELGIDAEHKHEMNDLARKFLNSQDVIRLAKEGAMDLHTKKGWGLEFSLKYSLEKISGGMAILEAFNEFVESKGKKETLFYRYAMSDIRVESELYNKILQI